MGDAYKRLGAVAPSATTETDLYTVPAATSAIASSIIACNRGTATTYRISHSPGGGATVNADYLFYDVPIAANDSHVWTIGVGLATTDKLRVYAGSASMSFGVWGDSIT